MGLISALTALLSPLVVPDMSNVGLDAVVGNLMVWMNSWIGNIGLTVVVFTLFLKLVIFPLDFFSRRSMKIYQLKMEKVQPQMDKIKKQYANNKQLMQQKLAGVQKKMGVSALASCLPTIVTLVLFIYVFAAFRSYISYTNFDNYDRLARAYNNAWETAQLTDVDGTHYTLADKYGNDVYAYRNASEEELEPIYAAVVDEHEKLGVNFLWIKNIALADVPWTQSIAPTSKDYLTGNMSDLNLPEGGAQYRELFKPILEKYSLKNDDGTIIYENGVPKTTVNGFLIMPILAVGLSIGSQFITMRMQKKTNPMSDTPGQGMMMKVMMFIFPLMYLSFALSSSSAFTIYMTVNTAISLLITLLINVIVEKTVRLKEERAGKPGVGRRQSGTEDKPKSGVGRR